jgi:hypothetical protein
MIGNRFCALALAAALAFAGFAPSAIAAQYDGNWNMLVVTTNGHCGKIKVGLGVTKNRVYSTSGSFVLHPIRLAGRISSSGQVRMNAVAGPRVAKGTGRFVRAHAKGTWSGTGPSGLCSGIWTAVRA